MPPSPSLFRDWFFDRLIWSILSGMWVIKIKDFKNSKDKREREFLGLTMYHKEENGGIIYLDKKAGTPKVLVHELGHVFFGDILDDEARDKNRTSSEIDCWMEDQILEFEEYFFKCLSVEQIRTLKVLIDRAKIDFKKI